MNKKLEAAFLLYATAGAAESAHAAEQLQCQKFMSGGYEVKIATLKRNGETIALNGQARDRVVKNGWIDGNTVFDPPVLRQKTEQAIALCDPQTQPSARETVVPKSLEKASTATFSGPLTPQALVDAANKNDAEFIKRYIAARRNVNVSVDTAVGTSTAVEAAAASGHCEALDWLLDAGGIADPRSVRVGFTPLTFAATAGASACVRSLLKRHVRLDVRTTPGGDTALIIAAYQGHLSIAKDLVDAGASLKLSNNDGDTPYRAALAFNNVTVAQYLKSRGGR
jgi:hypothetical protein